jgi:hypothetical protein
MSDRYIDTREASEYGRYTWSRLESLLDLSRLVNVAELRLLMMEVVEGVENEYRSTRTQQSGLRVGRASTTSSADDLADVLRRFHHFIETLASDIRIDRAAFFPTQSSGKLSKLKPADLLTRADEVLHGFTVPSNALLPGADTWSADVAARRLALADGLGGKYGASHGNSQAVSALSTARERFLAVYNGMAKRLVYVVLADLGRLAEYRQFFLDLQVNEGGRRSTPTPDGEAPDVPGDDVPGDDVPGDDVPGAPAL